MVGEGAVNRLVVGVADDSAARIHDTGVGGIGVYARPTVLALPSRRGHPALGDMRNIAQGHRANRLQRD